ncbi:MAG: protein translocase subunit SecF [Alphaproteobacteria bacterium]
MFNLNALRAKTNIDFMTFRRFAFVISIGVLLLSVGSVAVQKMNFGIDFVGGTLIEIRFDTPPSLADLRGELGALELGEVALQEFGDPTDVLIRIEKQPGAEREQIAAIQKVKDTLGEEGLTYRRTEFVGPQVGDELIQAGILAIVLSLLGIMIYVWFRFEWQFGIGALAALAHDVVAIVGLFSLFRLEFNLASVAAILLIAGYSINDTVVVYDRVRENMRKFRKLEFTDLVNLSINDMLSRTVLTSLTTLLALGGLFLFGGQVIRDFTLAMIVGVVVGTYSSIFVAAPLLNFMPGSDLAETTTDSRP